MTRVAPNIENKIMRTGDYKKGLAKLLHRFSKAHKLNILLRVFDVLNIFMLLSMLSIVINKTDLLISNQHVLLLFYL